MALRPCGECGQTISERARTCPHCGITHPFKSSAQRKFDDGCGTVFVGTGGLGCGLLVLGCLLLLLLILLGGC